MQAVFVARDKFKAQLDTLKANTQVTVDKRPSTPSQTLLSPIAQLTASEREALQKAVSRDYLVHRFRESTHIIQARQVSISTCERPVVD